MLLVMLEITYFTAAEHCEVWFLVSVFLTLLVLRYEVVRHIRKHHPGWLTGRLLSVLYPMTCIQGKTSADTALWFIETDEADNRPQFQWGWITARDPYRHL